MMRKISIIFTAGCALVLAHAAAVARADDHAQLEKKVGKPSVEQTVSSEEGIASFYGGSWIGKLTANGETYRKNDMTAAHKKLPFDTRVKVTNLRNNDSTIVRINNRGPFIKGRIIDLSEAAAKAIGLDETGIGRVRLEVLGK